MSASAFQPSLTDALLDKGLQRWQQVEALASGKWPSSFKSQAQTAFALSDFVFENVQREPNLLIELLQTGRLQLDERVAQYFQHGDSLAAIKEENELMRALRRWRQQEMLCIAWRDINGLAPVEETLRHLSQFADAVISTAMRFIEQEFASRHGQPLTENGTPQQMLILGMGKLGGEELNFSSDIDLIFAYSEDGETAGPRKMEHQSFFTRVGQKLIQLLSTPTADGIVFRTDMRLRPYGDSGPLAMSLDAMEDYYQDQGREWERFAMIKARVMHGDPNVRERYAAMIKPFVYRRYIDYGVLEAIRRLKALINQDLRRKQHGDNIKLGAGGIREVEFIVQAFQLIKGGREPMLQSRQLLPTLTALDKLGLLEQHEAKQLRESYLFLRKAENILQAQRDQQTQILPDNDERKAMLAASLGYVDYKDFRIALDQHRDAVHSLFAGVFGAPTPLADKPQAPSPFRSLWLQQLPENEALTVLKKHGFTGAEETLETLYSFRRSTMLRQLSERGRTRIDSLMPLLLTQSASTEAPDEALKRVMQLLKAVCRRTAYLELLSENQTALSHLVKLCGESIFISNLLTQFPILLDDLLDAEALYQPPAPDTLRQELQLALLRIERDDQELLMETLREFRNSHMLRVAAANLAGALDIVQVSRQLTALAEAILSEVLELAWQQLAHKHGQPPLLHEEKPFLIIGYGKLGGGELSFSSDLDLVFLYEGDVNAITDGERSIGIDQFFTRLAQRIMHMLSTRTPAGILYEVDTRLRPSGSSGLLVCSLEAYAQYQDDEAWTWEHQALVRARAVAGSQRLATRFREMRLKVLQRSRPIEKLRADVISMRNKMREALDKSNTQCWDIKQGEGGVIDIEFLVQYWVLQHAGDLDRALQLSHSVSLLEQLAERDLIAETDVASLREAYRVYRDTVNRLSLQDKPNLLGPEQMREHRDKVLAIWQRHMAEQSEEGR
ncbi:bifunctional [glutamate--ammonia ligase]-adenylyl-L-tyrosine phosphorylase/[glutamate--ammonia-ligase] adenylyltransferase [Permianibacter aggregans]|uniref:Bifunctional glutamine synthetase adenylyltransferase/adenylyl-removing enzyme n=1 Tax=Permianibacter aggregans TaxID=1510150 RepID=A0A4R6UKT5_9GAMM|nr:bifunctional [glutamate--ammonia ligase]-adenylyl-L-tyrosine phosphorylase/[glutamate--ammonia-ligase] adenylyltransferase [Permianibacter aggregans]QGX40236.1 bifunctional [glutamate--ammonia ligase]-adenylyl-L-tyrosine phosphorylase/[glutamate--ammonia-ligase] adenylyltransferase [Permianibacter aggregans]TDQ47491.1 glutamate-ammonia-ligase adenylyltransferase [Permianibacter aggregans]